MALALKNRSEYNGKPVIVERPDETRAIALAHACPLWDERGTLVGAVNILVDVADERFLENMWPRGAGRLSLVKK
jgi:hypothetical protein